MNQFMMQSGTDVEKYVYVRGFASRICLILERFLANPGYQVPSPDPLEEAIDFFQTVLDQRHRGHFDSSVVNNVLLQATLRLMAERDLVEKEKASVPAFCDFAITVLKGLLPELSSGLPDAILEVHDCFCTMEGVVDKLVAQKQPYAAAYSLNL